VQHSRALGIRILFKCEFGLSRSIFVTGSGLDTSVETLPTDSSWSFLSPRVDFCSEGHTSDRVRTNSERGSRGRSIVGGGRPNPRDARDYPPRRHVDTSGAGAALGCSWLVTTMAIYGLWVRPRFIRLYTRVSHAGNRLSIRLAAWSISETLLVSLLALGSDSLC
jgi:hypothetical protein